MKMFPQEKRLTPINAWEDRSADPIADLQRMIDAPSRIATPKVVMSIETLSRYLSITLPETQSLSFTGNATQSKQDTLVIALHGGEIRVPMDPEETLADRIEEALREKFPG